MFTKSTVIDAFKNLIGWKQYFDTEEIEIPAELTESTTGEYFQQKHPALQLNYIETTIPANRELAEYLATVRDDSIVEMLNDFITDRQKDGFGKTLLENSMLLNRYGWINDKIVNQSRFVGLQIRLWANEGLSMILNQIGLQFTGVNEFDLYLFHSSQVEPIQTFKVETDTKGGWKWIDVQEQLNAFKNLDYNGGVFVLGYYQDDITGQAINYSNFDWNRGECGTCNNSYGGIWQAISKYYHIAPLYVPSGSYTKGEMFDLQKAIYHNSQSWGLNLRLSVRCDLTQFFVENKFAFKNLLGLKVVEKVFEMMKFSQEINALEENIKYMIIRALEGDKETNVVNVPQSYRNELKGVKFNTGNINNACLPCDKINNGPVYSVV